MFIIQFNLSNYIFISFTIQFILFYLIYSCNIKSHVKKDFDLIIVFLNINKSIFIIN